MLYADASFAEFMKSNAVLHWSSERPVPRITVDMGDGRIVERTVTGNAAHYLMLPSGHVVDVLPGLMTPSVMQRKLTIPFEQIRKILDFGVENRESLDHLVRKIQDGQLSRIPSLTGLTGGRPAEPARSAAREAVDVSSSKADVQSQFMQSESVPARQALDVSRSKMGGQLPLIENATAGQATERSMTKMGAQMPLLSTKQDAPARFDWAQTGLAIWGDVVLSWTTTALIRAELKGALSDSEIEEVLNRLRSTLAGDNGRSGIDLHRRTLDYLIANPQQTFDSVNRWVYANIFLTPASDPWLGLISEDAYSGIFGGGFRVVKGE